MRRQQLSRAQILRAMRIAPRSCRSVGVRFGSARCAEVSRRGRQHCAWRNKADWLRKFNTERVDGVLLVTGADLLSVTFQSNELLGILAGSIKVVYSEVGQTRPGAQRGHEHFGFLDGVSQPGIRGLTTTEAWQPRSAGDIVVAPVDPKKQKHISVHASTLCVSIGNPVAHASGRQAAPEVASWQERPLRVDGGPSFIVRKSAAMVKGFGCRPW